MSDKNLKDNDHKKMNLITMIREDSLCSGCGACYAVCQFNAISMQLSSEGTYRPFINPTECRSCGLCEKVCPSISINQRLSSSGLGVFIRCYTGYSTDQTLRWNASSGGIATALILSLFDEELIGGAIVLKDDPENPLKPQMVLVNDPKAIAHAMGSRYCPVVPSFKIKELIEVSGKIAIVGLPCHISAFTNLDGADKRLKNKFIKIGLFCGRCPNIYATEYFIKQKSVKVADVSRITYRGEGWPGKFSVQTKQGSRYTFHMSDWCRFSYYPHFVPVRCALCPDLSNQLADITLGDAWGLTQDQIGTSIIISRTDLGEQVLNCISNKGRIILQEVSPDAVSKGQGLAEKVRNSLIRALFWQKIFKRQVPFTVITVDRITKKEWVLNLLYCTMLYFSQKPYLRVVMCHTTVQLKKLARR